MLSRVIAKNIVDVFFETQCRMKSHIHGRYWSERAEVSEEMCRRQSASSPVADVLAAGENRCHVDQAFDADPVSQLGRRNNDGRLRRIMTDFIQRWKGTFSHFTYFCSRSRRRVAATKRAAPFCTDCSRLLICQCCSSQESVATLFS